MAPVMTPCLYDKTYKKHRIPQAMLLESITLHHIRSYLHQELRFSRGSTLLAGDIGAGKSSILLAIEFALFGAQRDGLPGESLLRKGASDGYVELSFSVDGKEVTIRRTLKKSKDGVKQDAGHIIIGGNRIDATPIELKTRILDLVGYPSSLLTKSKALLYRYTVYTPQEHMKRILEDQREERLDTLRRVFGVDKYRRMADNTSIIERMMREDLRELQGQVSDVPEKLQQQDHLRQSRAALLEQLQHATHAVEQHERLVAAKKQDVEQREKGLQHLLDLQHQRHLAAAALNHRQAARAEKQQELHLLTRQLAAMSNKLDAMSLPGQISLPGHDTEGETELHHAELQRKVQEAESRHAAAVQQHTALATKLELLQEQRTLLLSRAGKLQDSITVLVQQQKSLSEKETFLAESDYLRQHITIFSTSFSTSPPSPSPPSTQKISSSAAKDPVSAIAQLLDACQNSLRTTMLDKKAEETRLQHTLEAKQVLLRLDSCPTCLQQVPASYKDSIVHQQDTVISSLTAALHQYDHDLAELAAISHLLAADHAFLSTLSTRAGEERASVALLPGMERDLQEISATAAALDSQAQALYSQLTSLALPSPQEKEALAAAKQLLLLVAERDTLLASKRDKEEQRQHLHQSIMAASKECDELAAKLSSYDPFIQELPAAGQLLLDAKTALEQARQQHHCLAITRAEHAKGVEGVTATLASLAEELSKKQKIQAAIIHRQQLLAWLDQAFLPILSSMERHVMSRIYHEFNKLFQVWFSMLLEDGQLSIRLDDSFSPIIEQNGFDIMMDSLSGGEKTAIALAYRLSLNRVISSVISTIKTKDIIILDEPTDGFSTEQLDKLRDVLHQLGTEQTIIVSHEAKIESFVDHVLRVEKEGHVSRVVG